MSRHFTAPDGTVWIASLASHGRTSEYLNRRVHRPIVEFRPVGPGARRYAALPADAADLEALDEQALARLFERATAH